MAELDVWFIKSSTPKVICEKKPSTPVNKRWLSWWRNSRGDPGRDYYINLAPLPLRPRHFSQILKFREKHNLSPQTLHSKEIMPPAVAPVRQFKSSCPWSVTAPTRGDNESSWSLLIQFITDQKKARHCGRRCLWKGKPRFLNERGCS